MYLHPSKVSNTKHSVKSMAPTFSIGGSKVTALANIAMLRASKKKESSRPPQKDKCVLSKHFDWSVVCNKMENTQVQLTPLNTKSSIFFWKRVQYLVAKLHVFFLRICSETSLLTYLPLELDSDQLLEMDRAYNQTPCLSGRNSSHRYSPMYTDSPANAKCWGIVSITWKRLWFRAPDARSHRSNSKIGCASRSQRNWLLTNNNNATMCICLRALDCLRA